MASTRTADSGGLPNRETRTLSEAESASLLARSGVPVVEHRVVADPEAAGDAATEVGPPVVVKACGAAIAHKTERGLVRLGLGDRDGVVAAAGEVLGRLGPDDGDAALLVAPMLSATRELICGLHRDPQFGPVVMIGLGGILAEAVGDVAVRLVPVGEIDAAEMVDDLDCQRLLGAFRGEPPVDRDALASLLVALSRAAAAEAGLISADCNPVVITEGRPVAVDTLVEVAVGPGGDVGGVGP